MDQHIHLLADYATPLYLDLKRVNRGEDGNPDASQDQYLGLMMEQAIRTGEIVTTVAQP